MVAGRRPFAWNSHGSDIHDKPGGCPAISIWFVTAATYPEVRERLSAGVRAFADAAGFEPEARTVSWRCRARAASAGILFGI